MKAVKSIKFITLILMFIMLLSFAFAASEQVIVLNSQEWQDMYLGTLYAGLTDSDLIYFDNLAEAQQKTETLPKWNSIIVLESDSKPVLKSYANFLTKKEITNFEVIIYDGFNELQEELFVNQNFNSYAILNTKFGMEALAIAPYLIENDIAPLFLDSTNVRDVKSAVSNSEYYIAGKFPVRDIQDLNTPKMSFDGTYTSNLADITVYTADSKNTEWGVLAKPDNFDLSVLLSTNPLFLYMGDVEETADIIKKTQVTRFEVVGNDLADVSKNIEASSGKDLKLIVKYGQTITNLPGMEGKILDIDSIYVDFPYANIELVGVDFYENSNILAVKFKNTGNIDALVSSTIEFGGAIYIDEDSKIIPEGEEITIPYTVTPSDDNKVVLDVQFDFDEPLRKTLFSKEGLPIINEEATTKTSSADTPLILGKIDFDDNDGVLYVELINPTDKEVNARFDLILRNELIESSKEVLVPALGKSRILLQTPYNTYDDFRSYETKIRLYYGPEDTIFEFEEVVKVSEVINYVLIGAGLIVLLIIMLVLVLIVKKKR